MYPTRHPLLKHLISIILCMAMVITLLTPTDLTAYADEGEDKDFVVVPQDEQQAAVLDVERVHVGPLALLELTGLRAEVRRRVQGVQERDHLPDRQGIRRLGKGRKRQK